MSLAATQSGVSSPAPPERKSLRKRRSRPGASMLAGGEPLLWLTGGALVICVAMIIYLLWKVTTAGMASFWPIPVEQIELRDGQVVMGEVTRRDAFMLTDSVVDNMSGVLREAATEELAGDNEKQEFRRLVRTGNYEITNEHFQWVSDFQIQPDGVAFPEWAVVVERIEWGRFYGFPSRFVLIHYRDNSHRERLGDEHQSGEQERPADVSVEERPADVSAEERNLGEMVDFLQANTWRLAGTADTDELASLVAALQERLAGRRTESMASFLDEMRSLDGGDLFAVTDTNEQKALNEASKEHAIVEVKQVWTKPEQAWAQFRRRHEQVRELWERRRDLEKHESGRVNRYLEEARLEVRQAEIDSERSLLGIAEQLKSQHYVTYDLKRSREKAEDILKKLTRMFGETSEEADLANRLTVRIHTELAEQNQAAQAEIEALWAKLEKAPESARAAVKNFLAVAEEAQRETIEINQQIDANTRESRRYQLVMSTVQLEPAPAATMPLTTAMDGGKLSAQAIDSLVQSNLLAKGEAPTLAAGAQGHWRFVGQTPGKGRAAFVAQTMGENLAIYSHVEKALNLEDIVRAYPANQLSLGDKLSVYGSRWWEFLSADPREANSEGGVFPAIWGTVAMTMIMSLMVVPFGVLAALYLREYAQAGPVVSVVRIAINNLAGVPSIVFGVFGLGFFCYLFGSWVDGGPQNAGATPLPPLSWWTVVGGAALCGGAAWFVGLIQLRTEPSFARSASALASIALWVVCGLVIFYALITTPYFSGFFQAHLPNPVLGKGGLLWASLTLALLTLPVVIVATEEALSAVPNSLREGSYACGGSKWQTIYRIVLPYAAPGIMTGTILAMARGAGEVAPLMLVGAVKLAPELPIDSIPPFLHLDRSFMHLGFHIFDLGFQSQNSEAAKPMVFTTTLLLIAIVALLNIFAILLRSRLKQRFRIGHF